MPFAIAYPIVAGLVAGVEAEAGEAGEADVVVSTLGSRRVLWLLYFSELVLVRLAAVGMLQVDLVRFAAAGVLQRPSAADYVFLVG